VTVACAVAGDDTAPADTDVVKQLADDDTTAAAAAVDAR